MPLEDWVSHSAHDRFLYDWQTLIAAVLAVLAAAITIWTTRSSANREIDASQAQTKVAQDQIATTLRVEQRRVAREIYAFRAMLEAAMGRVIAEAKEARELFAKAPRFDEDAYSKAFDKAADVSRTSLQARYAREQFTKSAFSELRSACLQHGGLLTAEFLELESLIDKFASATVDEEMLNLRDQPTVVRLGYHDDFEKELAVIEAKAHHLREEAAKGMTKAGGIMAEQGHDDQ